MHTTSTKRPAFSLSHTEVPRTAYTGPIRPQNTRLPTSCYGERQSKTCEETQVSTETTQELFRPSFYAMLLPRQTRASQAPRPDAPTLLSRVGPRTPTSVMSLPVLTTRVEARSGAPSRLVGTLFKGCLALDALAATSTGRRGPRRRFPSICAVPLPRLSIWSRAEPSFRALLRAAATLFRAGEASFQALLAVFVADAYTAAV